MFHRLFQQSKGRYKKFTNISRSFTEEATKKQFTGTDYLGIAVFAGISLATGGLGVWQLKRYFEKTELIEERSKRLDDPLLAISSQDCTLSQLVQNGEDQFGRKTILEGEFLHEHQILVGLRAAPAGLFQQAQGLQTNPQGYFVITPFRLTNG